MANEWKESNDRLLALPREKFLPESVDHVRKYGSLTIYGHDLQRLFDVSKDGINLRDAEKIGEAYAKQFGLLYLAGSWRDVGGGETIVLYVFNQESTRRTFVSMIEYRQLWALPKKEFLEASANYVRKYGGLSIKIQDLSRIFDIELEESSFYGHMNSVEKIYQAMGLLAQVDAKFSLAKYFIVARDPPTLVGMLK